MLAANVPANFPIPFANSAGASYITTPVPQASQISVTPGRASLTDGFPPLNFLPVPAGGVPFWGADVNGLMFQITSNIQWYQAGGTPKYSSSFSSAIGGYPNGAILQNAAGTGIWLSTVDNNTSNPDTGGANWVAGFTSPLAVGAAVAPTHAVNLGQFASSLGASGYITIPTVVAGVQKNLVIQWGQTGASSSSGPVTVTYPIAFPNGVYTVTLGAVGSAGVVTVTTIDGSTTAASFPYSAWNLSGARVSGLGSTYIAIGH